MNKQNKKIAQEKRRIEREKAEKKAKVVNLLKFWVPVVAVVVCSQYLPYHRFPQPCQPRYSVLLPLSVNHCFVSLMPEIPWSVMQLAYRQCPLTMNRPMSQLPR